MVNIVKEFIVLLEMRVEVEAIREDRHLLSKKRAAIILITITTIITKK
jgi:hypothetical protein